MTATYRGAKIRPDELCHDAHFIRFADGCFAKIGFVKDDTELMQVFDGTIDRHERKHKSFETTE